MFGWLDRHGVADKTISGGRVVCSDGELQTVNGSGNIVKREPFGYAYRDHAVEERLRNPARKKVEREPYTGPVIEL